VCLKKGRGKRSISISGVSKGILRELTRIRPLSQVSALKASQGERGRKQNFGYGKEGAMVSNLSLRPPFSKMRRQKKEIFTLASEAREKERVPATIKNGNMGGVVVYRHIQDRLSSSQTLKRNRVGKRKIRIAKASLPPSAKNSPGAGEEIRILSMTRK